MKTFAARPREVRKKWILIDADGVVLGRLASFVADRLRGKHLRGFTPHVDDGDHVIVINAEKVHLTGRKRSDKIYYAHTGYPGGIKSRVAGDILAGRFPDRVILKAVARMIPRGPLGRQQLSNLRVYAGPSHPHTAQTPQVLDFAVANPKNSRRAHA